MEDDTRPASDPPIEPEQAQELAKQAAATNSGKGKLLAMKYMGHVKHMCFFEFISHFEKISK